MRSWLVAIRKSKKMTQRSVAECAGISRAYYAQIELSMRNPSVRVAIMIANLLDFNWTAFYNAS